MTITTNWTRDRNLILQWSMEAYELKLYREDGIAQWFLTHHPDYKIQSMAYLPSIAWAANIYYRNTTYAHCNYYTHPDYRRQGIANKLYQDYLLFAKEQLQLSL